MVFAPSYANSARKEVDAFNQAAQYWEHISVEENSVSVAEFARRLKEKYPKYVSAADDKLVVAFCQKFPQYKVNYEGGAPVSVSVMPKTAAPATSTATSSSNTAPVAVVATGGVNESSAPSSAPSVRSNVASHTPEKVPTETPVAPSTSAPVPPAPARPEPRTSDVAPVPDVSNLQPTAKAGELAAAPQATSHGPSVEPIRNSANALERSGKKGSRVGVIVIGLLIIAALAGFGAYQFGLIPRKSVPRAKEELAPRSTVNDDRSSYGGGAVGEYISGRTTYSDQFVNIESIRVRRSGQTAILTATVYNKSDAKLNAVTINASCYSANGTQVVNASFTVHNLLPGARATQDMTGVLTAVPSRVDIVRVNHY